MYHELPSIKNKKREKIPEGTLCVVCSDFASGIHYSVASCNGCKTFFRRALVNKQTFTCQFSGDCVVGKCDGSMRLQKLSAEKMLRYGNGSQGYRSNMIETKSDIRKLSKRNGKKKNENDHHSYDPEAQNDVKAVIEDLLRLESRVKSLRNSYRFESQVSATSCMYSSCLLDDITYMAENTHENEGTIEPFECSVEKLREWFVRDLSLMLEWGKCLPIMERLLLNDKLALMKAFAPIFPLIQLAFYTRNEFECDIVIKLEPDCTPKPIPERLNYPDGSFIEKGNKPANTW
nr:hypothetical protein T03G6.2 - Caenorhabditis elegans [Caenorhabditis elegans]